MKPKTSQCPLQDCFDVCSTDLPKAFPMGDAGTTCTVPLYTHWKHRCNPATCYLPGSIILILLIIVTCLRSQWKKNYHLNLIMILSGVPFVWHWKSKGKKLNQWKTGVAFHLLSLHSLCLLNLFDCLSGTWLLNLISMLLLFIWHGKAGINCILTNWTTYSKVLHSSSGVPTGVCENLGLTGLLFAACDL